MLQKLQMQIERYTFVGDMTPMMNMPTRVCSNMSGVTSTCIDHIYTNASEFSSRAIPCPIGFSNHNIVAIERKTKVLKSGPRAMFQRSYIHLRR